jgi:uncharacterized protein (TIGR04552 family)
MDLLRVLLRGESVIDFKRLALNSLEAVDEFLRVQEYHPDEPADRVRMEAIKREAIAYLRRNFEYPIPRAVAEATVEDLFLLASGKGHKQVCACVILKVMHVIHHLQGRELLSMLPLSDAEVFHLVEAKVYRVLGEMLARSLPITEFLGGRKNRDSLYTKLLSKSETIAAQIYDKVRFRVVARTPEDVLPVANHLARKLFPYNYVIPGESKNTLVRPRELAERVPSFGALLAEAGMGDELVSALVDNRFSAPSYRVIHFVVDMPVRVGPEVLRKAPPAALELGAVVFVLVEFQLVDQATELKNESGDASHARYKDRQRVAVKDRLRLGTQSPRRGSRPPPQR